jgi:hypothetical protein
LNPEKDYGFSSTVGAVYDRPRSRKVAGFCAVYDRSYNSANKEKRF